MSTSRTRSAQACWMAWWPPIGRPPCTRVRACSTARSRTRWAAPTISAVRASAPAVSPAASASAPPASRSSAWTSTASNVTSKSFSPLSVSSGSRAMPRRSAGQQQEVAVAHDDEQVSGDVGVLDEQLGAAQPARHRAAERDGPRVEGAAVLYHRQRGDPLARGQRGEPPAWRRRRAGSRWPPPSSSRTGPAVRPGPSPPRAGRRPAASRRCRRGRRGSAGRASRARPSGARASRRSPEDRGPGAGPSPAGRAFGGNPGRWRSASAGTATA